MAPTGAISIFDLTGAHVMLWLRSINMDVDLKYPYEIEIINQNPFDLDAVNQHDHIIRAVLWLVDSGLKAPTDWGIVRSTSMDHAIFGFKETTHAVAFKIAFG
jgi:hypothetical protein